MKDFTIHVFTNQNPNTGMNDGESHASTGDNAVEAVKNLIDFFREYEEGTVGCQRFQNITEMWTEDNEMHVSAYRDGNKFEIHYELDNGDTDWLVY